MAVDRKRVIDALSRIEVAGNQQGLIPAYGVFVNQLPASFWNRFAERLTHAVSDDMLEPAEWLLDEYGDSLYVVREVREVYGEIEPARYT